MLAAFRHPAFVALWAGSLVSNIGGWMHNLAGRWLIFQLTDDARLLGLDALVSGVVTVALLPWGGVLADHYDRRIILMVSNLVQASAVTVLTWLAWTGHVQVWHVIVVTTVNGAASAAAIPAGHALLPGIVPRADLSNAIALHSTQFNIGRVIGPILGGIAYESVGPTFCFLFNAVSFQVFVVVLLVMKLRPQAPVKPTPAWRALRDGVGYVWTRPDVMAIFTLVTLAAFCSAPAISMLPKLVKGVYGLDPREMGFFQGAFGVGAVLGALLMTWRSKREASPWRVIGLLIILGVGEIGLWLINDWLAAAGCMLIIGMMMIATMVRLGASNQHALDDAVRGRVMSLQSLVFRGGQASGSFIAGVAAEALTLPFTFAIYGGALILGTAAVAVIVRTRPIVYRQATSEPTPGA